MLKAFPPGYEPRSARLEYRPPYDWDSLLGHLERRAIDDVETVIDGVYRRSFVEHGRWGAVEIARATRGNALKVTVHSLDERAFDAIVPRVARVFDLAADPTVLGGRFSRDPLLAPMIIARPGLRIPGGWDGFETAVRTILGQQVTLEAGRRLTGQLVRLCGERSAHESPVFPDATSVAAADLSKLGMPETRKKTLVAMAKAALDDPGLFRSTGSLEGTIAKLRAIRGVGEWTAHYIALRAIREADAFPAGDIGLLRGATLAGKRRVTEPELLALAERWRPWRAYAAQHLWAADAASAR